MLNVVDAPRRGAQRPRMRDVGVVHVVAGLVLLGVLSVGGVHDCTGTSVTFIPAAGVLSVLTTVAGITMVARVPRVSAVAPALASSASLALVAGAASGWLWVIGQPCTGNVLDGEVVTLVLVTASALATLATGVWLLHRRAELEPWYETRGVVIASVAAAAVLTGSLVTLEVVADASGPSVSPLATVVPWTVVVAATGWLRPSPAVAALTPVALQIGWLVLA